MAKLLMFFGLLFMACGEVGLGPYSSGSNGELSSGSQSSSSIVSSSNSCAPLNINLNLQPAPANSHVHGSTQITMDAYYISKYLITQGQYNAVMGDESFKDEALPVEGISWFKAVEFCKKLSAQMCLDSNAIKLPTEAQWEYAVFASEPVIQRNLDYWEWTNDCYDSKFPYVSHDPSGPDVCPVNFYKVRKGLDHLTEARFPTDPYENNIRISFRVAVKSKFYSASP